MSTYATSVETLVKGWIKERCAIGECPSGKLYEDFARWFDRVKRPMALPSKRMFTITLQELGYQQRRSNGVRIWLGIEPK